MSHEAQPLPFNEVPKTQATDSLLLADSIDIIDRLRTMKDVMGFYPTSRGELNESFGLLAFREEPGGAAKHLAEVSQHQVRHEADPSAAVRSITQEYYGYARRARTDRTMLGTLQEEVDDLLSRHPFNMVDKNWLHTGVGQLVRYVDLTKLAQSGAVTSPSIEVLKGYSKKGRNAYDHYINPAASTTAEAHIEKVIEGKRVWELKTLVDSAMRDQRSRFEFWADVLQQTRKHTIARPIASRALKSLGIDVA